MLYILLLNNELSVYTNYEAVHIDVAKVISCCHEQIFILDNNNFTGIIYHHFYFCLDNFLLFSIVVTECLLLVLSDT